MLTAQSSAPRNLLQPFIQSYVQRKTAANDAEFSEPVLPPCWNDAGVSV